jgi:hypothetical protein
MRNVVCAVVAAVLAVLPVSTGAWGVNVHRLITRRALEGLPDSLKPMFDPYRDFVVEHSVDPDMWRTVGLRGDLGPEDPNHFLDIDGLGEAPPYTGVPRDHAAFIAKYGAEKAEKAGRLPWRGSEMYGKLVAAFKAMGTGTSYGADNARYLSAVLAHYVEDANQPFHASENYDGQLTNQRGIHARFETELPLRHWKEFALRPVRVSAVPDLQAYMFTALTDSAALVSPILEADRRASATLQRDASNRLVYDDAYYARMATALRPIFERRLSDASDAVASVIVQAWTDAGKPTLK